MRSHADSTARALFKVWLGGLLFVGTANSEIELLRFGGAGGVPWADSTEMNLMIDDSSIPGVMQPLRLQPDQNIVSQLRRWTRYRKPIDYQWRPGMPRIWRGVGDISRPQGGGANPLDYIDGSLDTYYTNLNFDGRGLEGALFGEYYTLDMGLQIPVERFVLRLPEGNHSITLEPFRPNFAFDSYELTASNDVFLVESQVAPPGTAGVEAVPDYYQPLDILLASVTQNLGSDAEITFPLRYLRFLRIRLIPVESIVLENREGGYTASGDLFEKFALAELEVSGRGIVPKAVWESTVINMGHSVNVGQVFVGLSRWRVDALTGELAQDEEVDVEARIQIKTGVDDNPVAYYSYNDLEQTIEVPESEFDRLKNRIWPWDPPAVGWRGPIGLDTSNWSFWSTPMRVSGERPRLPHGQYLMIRVELETEGLWEYVRVDSLAVEVSPLLATRVLGEIALAEEPRPDDVGPPFVPAGEPREFVYDMAAEFEAGEPGFDALRVVAPSTAELLELRLGDGLDPVDLMPGDEPPEPSCECATWSSEVRGFLLRLPQRISSSGDRRLRLRLRTAVYGVTGEIAADALDLAGTALPQAVEAGDVSEELGSNQLRVFTIESSLGKMLGSVEVKPAVLTPQGDGVNEMATISYSLFRVLESARVDVSVYTLSGNRVWSGYSATSGGGTQSQEWGGRDTSGELVPPGLYVVRVEVETDAGREARVQPVAVAY